MSLMKPILIIIAVIIAFILALMGASVIDDGADSVGLKPSEDSSFSDINTSGMVTLMLFGFFSIIGIAIIMRFVKS